ncbi:MAG: hypothetical protein OXN18_09705 [Gemmatimonadota bacterium]|nr:hypothetical protein [Gemmatimonadota bacterium]
MRRLGIRVLSSCPSDARGKYKRLFRVLREALPQQLADAGIQSPSEANEFLPSYWKKFNRFVAIEPEQSKPAFISVGPSYDGEIAEILWQHENREVGADDGAGSPGQLSPSVGAT